MYKKILFSFIICTFLTSLQSAYAICASKIIFVEDDSNSVQYRINEANMIRAALNNAVGANNYIHIEMSESYEDGDRAVDPTRYPGMAHSWGHSLPYLALSSAVRRCDQNCEDEDIHGRKSKCAILYWGDNVITHKNPNMAAHDYEGFKRAMDDSHGGAINSSHRFFVNLSFVSEATSVAPELKAMSEELYTFAQQATYKGVHFRDTPTTELNQNDVNNIIAAVLDRFGHSE